MTPIEIEKKEFQKIGYQLIDRISEFFETIRERPVTNGESPKQLQNIIGMSSLPETAASNEQIVARVCDLLFDHSLFNGHPKFFGYITSSPAPMGALADLLVSSLNPNVGAQILSPIATEIEKQTIKWLAEFIGVSPASGGILVSGGNMANFTGFLAGRTAKVSVEFKENGIAGVNEKLTFYCSTATHTWIEKAAILFGHGVRAIRWIATDHLNRIDIQQLEHTIQKDVQEGYKPVMVVGTAGDVSTGAVDDFKSIAAICRNFDLWFHIDGAYGVPAAVVPALKDLFEGIEEADSIALDPHKWLYSPLEAGCTLVKNSKHLTDTFSSHPNYYNFDHSQEGASMNFYEYGLQNSRGFRALKVWMTLQQVGRQGYIEMISNNINLSRQLFDLAKDHPELEAVTHSLSIATLRYVPLELQPGIREREDYLNKLNEALLNKLQQGGEAFLSNAVVNDKYCLRACIVNFRTTERDIRDVIEIIVKEGKILDAELKEKYFSISK